MRVLPTAFYSNLVPAWALDQHGRSLLDLLDTLSELEAAGVALFLQQQAIDTTTAAGRMFFQVTGAVAEYAESVIMRSYVLDAERTVAKPIDPAGVWMAAASS